MTPTTTTAATSTTTTTLLPGTTGTTLGASEIVVAERPASTEESQRLDSATVLDCENEGGFTWDYGPIGDADPRGREATDALTAALDEINRDAVNDGYPPLPLTGWTALTGERSVDFVLIEDGSWLAAVRVGGDPDIGVWRHFSAVVCISG